VFKSQNTKENRHVKTYLPIINKIADIKNYVYFGYGREVVKLPFSDDEAQVIRSKINFLHFLTSHAFSYRHCFHHHLHFRYHCFLHYVNSGR